MQRLPRSKHRGEGILPQPLHDGRTLQLGIGTGATRSGFAVGGPGCGLRTRSAAAAARSAAAAAARPFRLLRLLLLHCFLGDHGTRRGERG